MANENYKDMVPYFHVGKGSCGKMMFYINRLSLEPGRPVHVEDVEYENGESPTPGERLICPKCRAPFNFLEEGLGGKAK